MKNKSPASNGKQSMSHKAGDALEKVGQKITNAGAEKIGGAVYKAGNKLEHSDDRKKAPNK